MKPKDLVIGKVYIYDNTECLVFDQVPTWGNNNSYVFVDHLKPQLNIQYLTEDDVEKLITELEIKKNSI
jgi:hypothetical protein